MTTTVSPAANLAPLQAVTGVVPPETNEVILYTAWPAVTDASAVIARVSEMLMKSLVLAPLAWGMLLPLYFKKVLPFLAKRYCLSNRRVYVARGLHCRVAEEVALTAIDEVRLPEASYNAFFRSGDLELVSAGKVVLTLTGVSEPESFRRAILNTVIAWVPGKAAQLLPLVPASAAK